MASAACAATVTDATGRAVEVPDRIEHVLPAGPPAAVLLEALAPDLMMGWPSALPDDSRALLAAPAARLPTVPRLTGREDVTAQIVALKPDLILDYGSVSPRYAGLARETQARTGLPTILLDGSLDAIPGTFRTLGGVLHREQRAKTLARFAEALLNVKPANGAHPRVILARGPDGLTFTRPGGDLAQVFDRLGWTLVAPPGEGPQGLATLADIRKLDPDVLVFTEPAMRETLAISQEWRTLRAVREGHALTTPRLPFGWLDEPPSINRLLGLAWLAGGDPANLASSFNETVYGHVLAAPELQSIITAAEPFRP